MHSDAAIRTSWRTRWVVDVEPPRQRPVDHALKYLARYVQGGPIAGERIVEITDTHVRIRTRKGVRTVRGEEFVRKLDGLRGEFPDIILSVQGTGLLVSAELAEAHPVTGTDGVEERMRKRGINVIHGGKNALRYTPGFTITSAQIDLIVDVMRAVFRTLS